MQFNEQESELLALFVSIGAAIGLGKLFLGGERLTLRLLLGRMIIGAGLSTSAGAILIVFNELPPIALVGVASTVGIMGKQSASVRNPLT
ncbi:holin [Burkholderia orbicola]